MRSYESKTNSIMHDHFLVKIRYEKTTEDGMAAKVAESYLVDALSFTEAEARITEEMRSFITGEFEVSSVRRCRVEELLMSKQATAARWYRCKVMYITIDEQRGIEKRTGQMMYAHAEYLSEALQLVVDHMETTLVNYEIASITETDIMDYFPYIPEGKDNDHSNRL